MVEGGGPQGRCGGSSTCGLGASTSATIVTWDHPRREIALAGCISTRDEEGPNSLDFLKMVAPTGFDQLTSYLELDFEGVGFAA